MEALENYVLGPVLGQGKFAQVFLGTLAKNKQKRSSPNRERTNSIQKLEISSRVLPEKVAIKLIPQQKLDSIPELRFQLANEIAILQKLSSAHPNLPTLHESITTTKGMYLVLPLCTNGSLETIIKSHKDGISEFEAVKLFKGVVNGFLELCSLGIVHRDLKPANILLKSDNQPVIFDFGFSTTTDKLSFDSNEILGSPAYMAPERLLPLRAKWNKCPFKAEMWSLGVILYQLLHGKLPWPVKSLKELVSYLSELKSGFTLPFANQNSVLCDLILSLLEPEQDRRPSLAELKDKIDSLRPVDFLRTSHSLKQGIELQEELQQCYRNIEGIENFPKDVQYLCLCVLLANGEKLLESLESHLSSSAEDKENYSPCREYYKSLVDYTQSMYTPLFDMSSSLTSEAFTLSSLATNTSPSNLGHIARFLSATLIKHSEGHPSVKRLYSISKSLEIS